MHTDNHVCMEVNISGLIKGAYKLHPDPLILEWARSMGIKLTLGSDSHRPHQVGQHFSKTIDLLKTTGFASLSYFKVSERIDVPIYEIRTKS